jgi:hypothetical protein
MWAIWCFGFMRRRTWSWLVCLDSSYLLLFPEFPSSVNIPWPEKGMGDADYLHAFQKIVMPIGVEFAPDIVISL